MRIVPNEAGAAMADDKRKAQRRPPYLYRLVGRTEDRQEHDALARARNTEEAAEVGRDSWFEQGVKTVEIEVYYLQEPTANGKAVGPLSKRGIVYEPAQTCRVYFFTKRGERRRRFNGRRDHG